MAMKRDGAVDSRMRLRLWPGVVFGVVLVAASYVVPAIAGDAEIREMPIGLIGTFAGLGCGLAIVVWWLFFSRAPWTDRLTAMVVVALALLGIKLIVHPSLAGGAMGYLAYFLSFPTLCLGLVAGAALGHGRPAGSRRALMLVCLLAGWGAWSLLRTNGVSGTAMADFEWRWTPTAEERLLAQERTDVPPSALASAPAAPADKPAAPETPSAPAIVTPPAAMPAAPPAPVASADAKMPAADAATAPPAAADPIRTAATAEWPGFRGPQRDGVVRGLQIATDWASHPPTELWRRPIGPGWSSFAVMGDLIFTQEQRGEEEVVSAYKLATGEPAWRHRDNIRFYESNGGPGPRGTPTVHGGRVYSIGATGVLNALDARTGARFWSRDTVADTGVTIPDWGIASSPLVFGDNVIVAVSGRLAAYDTKTGDQRWLGPTGGSGYSSPHLVTLDGVPQIVLLRGGRTISVSPSDGTLLWDHQWIPSAGIVQPTLLENGELLISICDAMGGIAMRRIAVSRGPDGAWKTETRWESRGLKPYYSDYVVHKGHAYGFDGNILSAIDLTTGERKWKGGRYGTGQMLLLADQDLLLLTSEEGDLVLVSATPDKHTEIAKVPAVDGKTWNHPVVVGRTLLMRNGEHMAAFRLPAGER